ncbi:MAG TPA: type II toxin-antitoxin system RelE/ParE family toxin [Devosia sp.]|nr:type II toxin-antitoxin system RelE/ParE family toxin [Devosia sp.]
MRVRISGAATTELEAIAAYIARDNEVRALSFSQELIDRCFGLAEHPERYPFFIEHRGVRMRRASYRGYLIFYSIEPPEVRVHHIVHGAQDYTSLLFPEG